MKVIIVDKDAPHFKPLGHMEAVAGMRSTSGNEIKSVNGGSCQVLIEGKLHTKRDVTIDVATAREFGWGRGEPPAAPARARKVKVARAGEKFGRGVFKNTPREQAEKIVAEENAAEGAERHFKVCQEGNEYDGLYGREVGRQASGWTVVLEIPTPGGEWVEELFDRSLLIPSAAHLFEEAARVCDGEAAPPASAPPARAPKFKTKHTAAEWREMAAAAVAHGYSTANYMFGGAKLTTARKRDWTARLKSAHQRLTVGRTMERIAGAVERQELPEVLRQVGKLGVGWLVEAWLEPDGYRAKTTPRQMGPVKTPEQFRAALEALTPLIARLPELTPDRCARCGHYVASKGGELLPHKKSTGAAGERWEQAEFCAGKQGAASIPELMREPDPSSALQRNAGVRS